MSSLGWITLATSLLAFVALWRVMRTVQRTFPQNSKNGPWRWDAEEAEQVEYWKGLGGRVSRLNLAGSDRRSRASSHRAESANERWRREVTPIAALAARARAERLGTSVVELDIPDQWSEEWLSEQCRQVEAFYGLDSPPRPRVRLGFFERLRQRLTRTTPPSSGGQVQMEAQA